MLTNVAFSTISSVINDVIIVVHDNNTKMGSEDPPNRDTNNCKSYMSLNATGRMSSTITSSVATQAIGHGVSQGQIITVLSMLVLFIIFGCLGNGLVLYVFSKKSDKATSTIFILALAWTDFFTCLIFMPFTAVFIYLNSRLYVDFFCKLYQFLNTSSVPLSAFIMAAIAVDRYFSICHPFMHAVTPRRARVAILCLLLVAFTFGSITACIYGVFRSSDSTNVSQVDPCYNTTEESRFVGPAVQDVARQAESGHNSSQLITDKDFQIIINNNSFWRSDAAQTTTESGRDSAGPESLSSSDDDADGICFIHYNILSEEFTEYYQKFYISFYVISLLVVFTLYFFIYRSVAERRAWRRKQKSFTHSPLTMTGAMVTVENSNRSNDNDNYTENLELSPQSNSLDASQSDSKDSGGGEFCEKAVNSEVSTTNQTKNFSYENGLETSEFASNAEKKTHREWRDFNFLANIRTAIMLFVVALVFIISFLPAWLMATGLIPFEIVIFYMHFIYNVANPVIYAFMNQSFRKELKRVFQRGTVIFHGG